MEERMRRFPDNAFVADPGWPIFAQTNALVVIEDILVSDAVLEEHFVCDLASCKGGCCEDGDAGAPLTTEELEAVRAAFDTVVPLLTEEGLREIRSTGLYRYDAEFGWVTPTVDGGICAYGRRDATGTIRCAFEEAYGQGLTQWKKPISCHLYPIKTSPSRHKGYEMINYEPRETLCAPACALGARLRVPVYRFLREPIVRKYGASFYELLEQVAQEHFTDRRSGE